ncbi:alpha/beta fold hydrolase BchO [Parasulfitobacter algicola]|uniref:Alpha/beta fold hydrolase n=1 Tax=Parasulfitobacter algicola TaxID=2614809 RepID=A0ABX2IKG5_9RHOB|nr:alpha/beta fold hydrolase BchO [Sulfitobacter algicola]NSX53343.1 alpha/beta fold hydrolase [Sulfitobacter algicola]
MDWAVEKQAWPNADHSHFIDHRPHRWHVQDMGEGPVILLLHGAGGATHSWRDLMPLLAQHYRVVAIDLPGQGFSQLGVKQRCSLPAMADDIASLIQSQCWQPIAIVGHSAGAAIALRLSEIGVCQAGPIIGLNAALGNFKGVAGFIFPIMAKILSLNPFIPGIFSRSASSPSSVKRLIEGTGSQLSTDGLQQYQKLISDPSHVAATLAMMAQWSLDGLRSRLPSIKAATYLIAAENDRTVPPDTSAEAAKLLPNAHVTRLENLGHLAHEEDPKRISEIILGILKENQAA